MERKRKLFFHSTSPYCLEESMIWELRSSGSKPIEAALWTVLRFPVMNSWASLLFNLQRAPALLACKFNFLRKHITEHFNVEKHARISALWLALFKMQLWKVCLIKSLRCCWFVFSAVAAMSHVYYSEIACLWTFPSEIECHFTWL